MPPVLTVRGLRKTYRGRHGVTANDGIDLDVAAGRDDLAPHPALRDVTHAPGRLTATLDADDATAVVDWARAATRDRTLERYALTPASLEDVYSCSSSQAVRAGLARTTFDMPGRSVVVLGAWCVASIALAALALRRRA